MSRWLRGAGVGAGCGAGAAAVSWPLLPQASEVLTSGRVTSDLGYAVFAQWWMGESLAGRGSFFDCPFMYFPDGQNLAASVWNLVALAVTAPMHWVAEPVTAWNLSILLIATLNGVAAYGLGQRISGRMGGIAAAAVVLCSPWMWMELFEGRIEQGLIAPLALYLWALLNLRDRRPRAWLAAGAAMGLVGATYWFMAILAGVALLPVLGRRITERAVWVDLLKAAGVSALVALPFFLIVAPFALSPEFASVAGDARRTFDMRVAHSVTPLRALFAHFGPASSSFPFAIAACLVWGARLPRAWPLIGALIAALVLAAGPVLTWDGVPVFAIAGLVPMPMWGLDLIPGFGRFIYPARAMAVAIVAAAGVAAVVAGTLGSTRSRAVAGVALVALLIEGHALVLQSAQETDPQLPTSTFDPPRQSAFFAHQVPDWMRLVPPDSGAMLSFPLSEANGWAPLFVPLHRRPLVSGDGSSEFGLRPAGFQQRLASNRLLGAWASGGVLSQDMAADVDELRAAGIEWIVQFRTPVDPDAQVLTESLASVFGPPAHSETRLTVWRLQ
jgi:hypothetical protein